MGLQKGAKRKMVKKKNPGGRYNGAMDPAANEETWRWSGLARRNEDIQSANFHERIKAVEE